MSILSIRALAASTADSRPRRSKTAMPFGCKAKAAPTSEGRSARSTSVTRAATRLSTKLAVSPPIPAPTTTAWSTVDTVDAVDDPRAVRRQARRTGVRHAVRTAPIAATTATQKNDHGGLSLDLGASGPRRSHIGARIALPELDEDIWPQPKALARAIDCPQPDRDIYWSATGRLEAVLLPAGGRRV